MDTRHFETEWPSDFSISFPYTLALQTWCEKLSVPVMKNYLKEKKQIARQSRQLF